MKGVMIQGTASNVGKSLVVTALCRWLTNRGYNVVPFKSQNMSNNSYVTEAGTEIGRAQGVQAEACKTIAIPEMNPILLKPRSDQTSEVICLGKTIRTLSGQDYRTEFYETGKRAIQHSLATLADRYDYTVIEGAGSPVEVNLNDRELVNMAVADQADVPVILVADIDRGGVFASIVGTLQLLPPHHRKRVKGLIINKFRGDPALFQDGIRWIESYTRVKVLGVLPHVSHHIEAEDSLSVREEKKSSVPGAIDLAVIAFPYLSNFTDVDPFYLEDDVSIRYVDRKEDFGDPDAVILPGTRSTIEDLQAIRERGIADQLIRFMNHGGTVAGICGGYQMLGEQLEEEKRNVQGLGQFAMSTIFQKEKRTRRARGTFHRNSGFEALEIEGYEIHLGEVHWSKRPHPLLWLDQRDEGAVAEEGRIIGTHLHHVFHHDPFRTVWLNRLREKKGLPLSSPVSPKKDRYDELASVFEEEIDTHYLLSLLEEGER